MHLTDCSSKDSSKINDEEKYRNEHALAHIYEDIDRDAPPKIAPFSGVFESSNVTIFFLYFFAYYFSS